MVDNALLAARGMTDVDTAVRAADESFRDFRNAQLPLISGQVSRLRMGLLAMLTRAEAFHGGALEMIRADNPFASYALIRSYAENAAALLWIAERPDDRRRLAVAAKQDEKLVVGRIVDAATKVLPGFKNLYQRLSEYAHPVADSFGSAWTLHPTEEGVIRWGSTPAFRNDEGRMWACLYLAELTDIHADYWPALYTNTTPPPDSKIDADEPAATLIAARLGKPPKKS